MGGLTANSWPYVTPDDHPKEYPAASQALANKLESLVGAGSRGGNMQLLETIASGTGNYWLDAAGTPTVWGGVTPGADYLQVPVAGWWLCGFYGGFNANTAGTYRTMRLAILGGDNTTIPAAMNNISATQHAASAPGWSYSGLAGSGLWYLTAGQGIRCMARLDSGVALGAGANMFCLYQHA
jgi:hypothetical protein